MIKLYLVNLPSCAGRDFDGLPMKVNEAEGRDGGRNSHSRR